MKYITTTRRPRETQASFQMRAERKVRGVRVRYRNISKNKIVIGFDPKQN